MKKHTSLPIDFSAVNAEILNKIQPVVDAETVSNATSGLEILVLENAYTLCESLEPALASETIVIEGIGRYRINDTMLYPYTLKMADIIIIPLQTADDCAISIYEPDASVEPFNTRFPVGVHPNHGFYNIDDCALVETVDIVEPIFVSRDTVWQIENKNKDQVAHFLILFSKSDNTAYFA